MCGRFDLTAEPAELERFYRADATKISDYLPRYNISPTQNVPVLFGEAGREFDFGRFGLHPEWFNHGSRDLFNLRSESLIQKPFFRRQLQARRCVLPATGFFEWKREGSLKRPFRFVPAEGRLLSLACVWEIDSIMGHDQLAFAIATGPANEMMRPIHERMPIILRPQDIDAWLDPETDIRQLEQMLVIVPPDYLRSYPVTREVNNAQNDRPGLIEPLS